MAGAPNTRNWKANEIPDFAGRTYRLVVSGDVEVTATNRVPKLSEHRPQGINPRILLLDLRIVFRPAASAGRSCSTGPRIS